MREHIDNCVYHVEILPPKHDSDKLDADLQAFAEKYNRVMDSGYCAGVTDNTMGLLAFQGYELIEHLGLRVLPEQVILHLNTFHSKCDLDNILTKCTQMGIKYLLIISGDGSARLPKLSPGELTITGTASVTSVELLAYIGKNYPDFVLGAAFNPYEPAEEEFAKLERKLAAGAKFIVSQPIIEQNAIVNELLEKHPDVPVILEAWMSKKLHLLSDAVGYIIPENAEYDPLLVLEDLHRWYPQCGVYLSLLGFKTQYHIIDGLWARLVKEGAL